MRIFDPKMTWPHVGSKSVLVPMHAASKLCNLLVLQTFGRQGRERQSQDVEQLTLSLGCGQLWLAGRSRNLIFAYPSQCENANFMLSKSSVWCGIELQYLT